MILFVNNINSSHNDFVALQIEILEMIVFRSSEQRTMLVTEHTNGICM
jgi:hypothetical protein